MGLTWPTHSDRRRASLRRGPRVTWALHSDLIVDPQLGDALLELSLGTLDEDEAQGDGHDPVKRVGEELDGRRLVLPAQQGPHQDEEVVRLVITALRRIPDIPVLPWPVCPWRPGTKKPQLLPLVDRRGEETCCDEHEENSGGPHEPIHAHLLRALEEAAADDPC